MNSVYNSLELFFKEKIFDLDDDEVENFLRNFSDDQVNECLNNKIQELSMSIDTLIEDTWKLGYTFGNFVNNQADKFIVSKITVSNLNLKEGYIKFLIGFWGNNIDIDISILKYYTNYIMGENSNWSHDLKMYSIEPIVMAYVNKKSDFVNDVELSTAIEVIKKYSENNKFDSELKDLLCTC